MRKTTTRAFFILALGCLLAAALSVSQAAGPPAKPETAPAQIQPGDRDACLECHGPFDNLVAGPKNITAENGEKINPHRYVPHNRKDQKSIPVCVRCHKPHPLPLASKADVPKPNIAWCYTCHHAEEFTPCGSCHTS